MDPFHQRITDLPEDHDLLQMDISTDGCISDLTGAISAPSPMAIPTSAAERAGAIVDAIADHDDFPAFGFFFLHKACFVFRQDFRIDIRRHPPLPQWLLPVRPLPPVIITIFVNPASFRPAITSGASSRSGSSMQITAASLPLNGKIKVGILFWEAAANFSSIPSGIVQFSSSNTK